MILTLHDIHIYVLLYFITPISYMVMDSFHASHNFLQILRIYKDNYLKCDNFSAL